MVMAIAWNKLSHGRSLHKSGSVYKSCRSTPAAFGQKQSSSGGLENLALPLRDDLVPRCNAGKQLVQETHKRLHIRAASTALWP